MFVRLFFCFKLVGKFDDKIFVSRRFRNGFKFFKVVFKFFKVSGEKLVEMIFVGLESISGKF